MSIAAADHQFDWQVIFRPASLSGPTDSFYIYLLDKNDPREHIHTTFIGTFYEGSDQPELNDRLDAMVPVTSHLLDKDKPIASVDVNVYHPGTQIYGELAEVDYELLRHLCVDDIGDALSYATDAEFESLFKTFSQIALQK